MALSNEQYQKIRRIYEDRRMHNDFELMRRREEVYQKFPSFHELDLKIAGLSMDCSRALIENAEDTAPEERLKRLRAQVLDLRMEKKRLLEENGYPRDYLEPFYTCSKCRDTGYIDGEKCSCFKQYEISFLYDASNLHKILEENNFSLLSRHYYTGEDLRRFDDAVEKCKLFISEFDARCRNLVFYGPVGTGKSFLSGCVAKELLDRGHSILYFSAQQLFQSVLNASYNPDKTDLNRLYDSVFNSDLLIIDDLGTEHVTDFTRSQLFLFLNERIQRKKSIIISTNKTLDMLNLDYSERVLSRLIENSFILHLTARDIRRQKKIENDYK